jgi:hypothetical protein
MSLAKCFTPSDGIKLRDLFGADIDLTKTSGFQHFAEEEFFEDDSDTHDHNGHSHHGHDHNGHDHNGHDHDDEDDIWGERKN